MSGGAIHGRCISYDVRMTLLRIMVLVLACGALSACGDDDFNSDSSVVHDMSANVDEGQGTDDMGTTD